MENLKIILAVGVVLLLGGGGYYGYTVMEEQDRIRIANEEKARQEKLAAEQRQAAEAALLARTKCNNEGTYSVITLDRDGGVGQDILVKQKVDGAACSYDSADAVFELKNEDPQYFKNQVENALLTDVGTGPSGRSFRLYDLKDKNMVVEKKYFDELDISGSVLTYFGLSKTKADKKNCKDFAQFTKDGLTPTLVVKKTIDLKTYSAKETKETKCIAAQ